MVSDRFKLLLLALVICAVLLPPIILFGPWTMLITGPFAVAPALAYSGRAGWLRTKSRRR